MAVLILGLVVVFAIVEATGAGRRFFVASSWACTLRRGASGVFRISIFRHSGFEYQPLIENGEDQREAEEQAQEDRGGFDGPQGDVEALEEGAEEGPDQQVQAGRQEVVQ